MYNQQSRKIKHHIWLFLSVLTVIITCYIPDAKDRPSLVIIGFIVSLTFFGIWMCIHSAVREEELFGTPEERKRFRETHHIDD